MCTMSPPSERKREGNMVHDGEFSVCYSLLLRGGTCNYTSRVSYRVFGLGGELGGPLKPRSPDLTPAK